MRQKSNRAPLLGHAEEVDELTRWALDARGGDDVALARFVPDQVKRLKDAHLAFQSLIETNQIVLATARAVSESIVRDLAADANKPMRANGYGPAATVGAGVFARPNSGPLVVSRRL